MSKVELSNSIYFQTINCCLGGFYFGYEMGIYNTLQDFISQEYHLKAGSQIIEGIITSAIPFGAILGAVLASFLLNYGRRKSLFICDVISSTGLILSVLPGIASLMIGRIICGIGVGLNSVLVPVYINEISPLEITGTTGSFNQFSICLGILASFVLGLALPQPDETKMEAEKQLGWRLLFLFPLLAVVFRSFILLACFKFETPLFDCLRDKKGEAEKFLLNIYCDNKEKVGEQMGRLERKSAEIKKTDITLTMLFTGAYLNCTLLSIAMAVSQQTSGINAVVFYSNKIFKATMGSGLAIVFTVISGVIMAFTAIISGRIVDKSGRKSLWLKGGFFCAFTLALLSGFKMIGIDFLNSYVILIFVFSFGISLGPILSIYFSEILSEKGMSLACFFNWGTAFLIGLLFPKLIDSPLRIEGTFLLFSLITFAFFIWFSIKMIETKGKTSEEIERLFNKRQKRAEEEEDESNPLMKTNEE